MKKINWTSVICYLILAFIVIGMHIKTTQDMRNMAETYTQQYANILTAIEKTLPETSKKIDVSKIELQAPTEEFMKDYYTVQSDWLMVWLTILAITLGFMGVIFPMIFADRKKELDETIKIADKAVKKLAEADLQEITKTLEEIQSADLDNKIKTLEQNMQDSNTKTQNDMIEIKKWKDEVEAFNLSQHGDFFVKKGNPQEAINCYNTAISILESLGKIFEASVLYNNKGNTYLSLWISQNKSEYIQNALADYNKAILLNPNYSNAYHNRGIAYLDLWEVEQKTKYIQNAIDDFKKTILLNPNDKEIVYYLAEAYIFNKQPKEALETLKDFKKKEPKPYIISTDRNAWQEALKECEQVPEVEEIQAIMASLPYKEPKP